MEAPPKVKNWLWRTCKEFLPTKDNLRRKGVAAGLECDMCHSNDETLWHLFVQCDFAVSCWNLGGFRNTLEKLAVEVNSCGELFKRMVSELELKRGAEFAVLGWRIWKERNEICWEGRRSTAAKAVYEAAGILHEWHRPRAGYVEFQDITITGYGLVLRDENGEFVAAKTGHFPGTYNSDEAEGIGLLEGLIWLKNMDFHYVNIEMDAKGVIQAVKNRDMNHTAYGSIIFDCVELLDSNNGFTISYISRNANCMAHVFVRASKSFSSPHSWVEPPDFVDGLLDSICISCDGNNMS
ncbi:hypothetical protein OROMI_033317 [Orobanche minor]